ncbi:hypothetical protein [Undibacterium sp. TS12]|uniref:hypothetical protein n=1 Tax=Undibacterium sp. TS12 TaxID=2908202 RepID=UPI001F4D1658|nr:hypothetical protein [Undibacterium sp. TS12]MCH8622607.1 hypothetical protein [Undibacterium sp. TS12]
MIKTIFDIWMQPIFARINSASRKSLWIALSLVLLTPPAIFLPIMAIKNQWDKLPLALVIGLAASLSLLLLVWFVTLVPMMLLQHSPANAGLVPGIKSRMLAALALPCVLLPLAIAFAFSFGNDGFSARTWFLSVLVLLAYVASLRSKWLLTLLALFLPASPMVDEYLKWQSLALWTSPVLVAMLGLALIAAVLSWAFGLHGDAHFEHQKALHKMRGQLSGDNMQPGQKIWQGFNLYNYFWRRGMAVAEKSRDQLAGLLPFALGPQVHWLNSFLMVGVMIPVLILYFLFFLDQKGKGGADDQSMPYFVTLMAFLMLPFIFVSTTRASLYQTRVEQALLCLVPVLPDPQQQTRTLMSFLLRQFLGLWLATLAVTVAVLYWSPFSSQMTGNCLIACFCLLPLAVMILKNSAAMKSQYETALLTAFCLPLVLALLLIGLHINYPQFTAGMICGGLLAGTVLVAQWRWQRLVRATAVFPAGRAV